MTGGVLNASDLMKIEKDSGVTFTKDLYNADLQRQNEAYKRDIEEISTLYYLNLEFVSSGYNGYEIILTKDRNILFLYENKYYLWSRI